MEKSNQSIYQLPAQPRRFGFYVDGQWQQAGEREVYTRLSPGHDVPVTETVVCDSADVDAAVAAARIAFDDRRWSGLSSLDRSRVLLKAAALIEERKEEIAYWESLENGKPISQALAEVGGTVTMFEYGAGAARSLHGDTFNNLGDSLFGLVTREPVGVVGLITPWNFPFLILCERVPFILASGCTMVVKPSVDTSATTLIMADILQQAGLPAGVFNVVTGKGSTVGQALIEHMQVDMLSFTGSTNVGRACVHAAADSNFKKLGLELGGKNPQIVFADADLDDAADGVAFGINFNSGQCCVSGSRLLVEASVKDQLVAKLIQKMAKVKVGDPLDPETQAGAVTTAAQMETITNYIAKGQQEGATLAYGGEVMETKAGSFVQPTLFTDVSRDMSIVSDEIFGPVLTVSTFETVDEAIAMANDTIYGLAASVWTKDLDKALVVSRRVQAGRFWVNTTLAGGCELPLGGFKQSGWGRETGVYGVEEYTQIKSIHVELGDRSHWLP